MIVQPPYYKLRAKDGSTVRCWHCGSNRHFRISKKVMSPQYQKYREVYCDYCSFPSNYAECGLPIEEARKLLQEAMLSNWERRIREVVK